MNRHPVQRGCCPKCNHVLAYRWERRHRFYRDVAYLLTWAVLIMTAPLNPRAWRSR